MPDDPHVDLAGYALDALTAEERTAFERHLEGCPECRAELEQLAVVSTRLATVGEPFELPPDLRERARAAVAAAARSAEVRKSPRFSFSLPRRGALVLAGAAAVALLAFLAGERYEARDRGPLEVRATLTAPDDPAVGGSARVVKTGIGRVIEFDTDELPILPKGEFYELWFVGPGDSLADPNRISAGTFHPDEAGRSHVVFAAAVDPAQYPVLSVTAEPGDGDPRRTGPEVLRSEP